MSVSLINMSVYTYFIGCVLFFPFWLLMYWRLKNDRRDILVVSLFFGLVGLTTPHLFCEDWWRPQTIFGGFYSIEDFLLGFTNGSLAVMGHRLFFREKTAGQIIWKKIIGLMILVFLVTDIMFYGFGLASFYSNFCGLLAVCVYVLWRRKDLFPIGLMSGIFVMMISLPVYYILLRINPTWISNEWLAENLSGIKMIGVPIEDVVWYLLIGISLGVVYPYIKNIYYEKFSR